MAPVNRRRHRPDARRWILDGEQEAIFSALPQSVLANLTSSHSESPLVWNAFYPLAVRRVDLAHLLALTPLWGTHQAASAREEIEMFFWGYGIDGRPMPGLREAVQAVDGARGKTEVDLFVLGRDHLIAVEAKRGASPGLCGRYLRARCPEVHPSAGRAPCRYWEAGPAEFQRWLEVGERPSADSPLPPCGLHYQLFRTLVLGGHLAEILGLRLGVWLVIPRARWPRLEPTWLDFADRVRDEAIWRGLRVIGWEDLLALSHDLGSKDPALR